MSNSAPRRRTQFSSCDACRHSRVACDASKHGYRPGKVRWRGECSRCSVRKRECTFEWISSVKQKASNTRRDTRSTSLTPGAASLVSDDLPDQTVGAPLIESHIFVPGPRLTGPLNSQIESAGIQLTRWSDQILHHGFETIFGLTIGRNGCPLVDVPTSDLCIPATKLFSKLDAYMDEELYNHNSDCTPAAGARQQKADQVEQSLRCAIKCFTIRWLPLAPQVDHLPTDQVSEIIRDSWRTARKDMLKVINRVSYRSMFTLYLFARTPIPIGISEDEELDGISGSACMQTALFQLQRLRERQGSCQFNGSKISTWTASLPSISLTQGFLDFESRAYWAAVIWDTSCSLTLNFRTSLTSGLKGACAEPAWRLARSFLVGSFHPETEDWRANGFELCDDKASKVISAAAVSNLYIWKNITSLKEALREGVNEDSVLFAWKALLDAIHIFKTSIRPLIDMCERRIHFLDQVRRLNWYEVSLKYYLGILVLVNTLQVAGRDDLLLEVAEARGNAEHESFNVLKFGLENTYTICGLGGDSNAGPDAVGSTEFPEGTITASFIAIDPYPQYVVESVLLMSKVADQPYWQGKIKHETYIHLLSILRNALEQLPQSSKSVQAVRESLQHHLVNTTLSLSRQSDLCGE